MLRNLCLYIVCLLGIDAFSQQKSDTTLHLQTLVVTGIQEQSTKETSLHLLALSSKSIQQNAAYNLSQALTALPGVNQLSTGIGISKPVIRGLYGNRVLVLLSSLKFDNQQWQDEHGLGLSDLGVERVELIKGPASVIYGSDAVAGVINVIEDTQVQKEGWSGEYKSRSYSNNAGTLQSIAFKGRKGNRTWRLMAGAESCADYSDGKNNRVVNSRFNGYFLKASWGISRKNWTSINNYSASLNHFGFIMDDLKDFFTADARWSRSMQGPHHTVLLNCISSQNNFILKNSLLKVNIGMQSNLRMEDEGGGAISLNMHLISLPFSVQWHKELNSSLKFILSDVGSVISNTNYGGRIIIPDARMMENGLSAFLRFLIHPRISTEVGIGGNLRNIQTYATGMLNTGNQPIQPFSKTRQSLNGLAGLVINLKKDWTFKLNAANGFRSPNLAELSSNGLHEGIFRFEIGNPSLKNEYNLNVEASTQYEGKHVRLSAAIFKNSFVNYIYLSPTNESIYGFKVYRYKQDNADLTGGEIQASIFPMEKSDLQINSSFSTVTGRLNSSAYLPFIPANKLSNSLQCRLNKKGKASCWKLLVGMDYVFEQNHPAEEETLTPAYSLWSTAISLDRTQKKGGLLSMYIRCNNALNVQYVDHLSRFKPYGIFNQGRTLIFGITCPIHTS